MALMYIKSCFASSKLQPPGLKNEANAEVPKTAMPPMSICGWL